MATKKSDNKSSNEDVLEVVLDLRDLMVQRFDDQDQEIAQLKSNFTQMREDIRGIYNILDAHMKRIEAILQESAMRDRKQDRMEKWILQIADKVGVKLKYD